jgi:biotin synthase
MTMPWQSFADRSIAGEVLERSEARAVLESSDDELLPVLDAAFRVRRAFHGRKVQIHVLENAKLGGCPEDCGFCSQSMHFSTEAGEAPIKSVDALMDGARRAKAAGAYRYCMVTATHGPSQRDLDVICEAATRIKAELDMSLCASLGFLTEEKAQRLVAAGVDRFNHNLETGEKHFGRVVSTHTFGDRVSTVRIAKQAGLETCSGGIIGMGETDDDILDLAYTLRALDTDSVPINFLDPRPGTPMANVPRVEPRQALRVLAMFRLLHPRADLRLAGGREVNLRALQPLALYAVNSIFTEGYLTTGGAHASDDHAMIRDMGFEIEVHGVEMQPPPRRHLPVAVEA